MDSFTPVFTAFASSNVDDTTFSTPSDDERGGSGGYSYCVVA
jgi:hypothetical protein